jgi:hypothetical protein
MQEVDVELVHGPVPLMVVRNIYTPEELSLIWRELEFLNCSRKSLPSTETGSNGVDPVSALPLTNSKSFHLNEIYKNENVSDILHLNKKIFDIGFVNAFCSLSPLLGHYRITRKMHTKIKYYDVGEYYRGHRDDSRFTVCTYFFKEPKLFTGGDLHFDEYNYTIPVENNMAVFFVGSVIHSSTDIARQDNNTLTTGFGKYVMNQFIEL